jgi:hypothetical protein
LADIYIDLKNKSTDKIQYSIKTKTEFINPDSPVHFLTEIGSDLLIEKTEESMKKYYLLEIFEATLPQYSVRKKIKQYFDFYFSNSWEDNTQEQFPTLLLVCPTTPALISTKRFAKKMLSEYDDIELQIKSVTREEILNIL